MAPMKRIQSLFLRWLFLLLVLLLLEEARTTTGASSSAASATAAFSTTVPFLRPLISKPKQHKQPDGTSSQAPTQARFAETATVTSSSPPPSSSSSGCSLDIVLFGIGDLRVDDHVGLQTALRRWQQQKHQPDQTNRVLLPVFVLTDAMVSAIPGVTAHTLDTANLLTAAVLALDQNLKRIVHPACALQTVLVPTTNNTIQECQLVHVFRNIVREFRRNTTGTSLDYDVESVRIHACDLGPVDNAMGYGPYGQLLRRLPVDNTTTTISPPTMEIVPWTNALRERPWQNVSSLSEFFPDYEAQCVTSEIPLAPVAVLPFPPNSSSSSDPNNSSPDSFGFLDLSRVPGARGSVPSAQELQQHFISVLNPLLDAAAGQQEVNTGLYATHWGGLEAASIGCESVLQTLQTYTQVCREDDVLWSQHPAYTLRSCTTNGLSLEHASMAWQLTGDGSCANGNVQTNWLAGEAMTRYLAAPLLFGTVSPRRIWHMAGSSRSNPGTIPFGFHSPLRSLVEGQEWHRLLAARSTQSTTMSPPVDDSNSQSHNTVYKYWRYHGFLCRYAETDFTNNDPNRSNEGILLVHGFGASGTQWNKAMQALRKQSTTAVQGLAPDLLGFGHSEKPAMSYTSYMWDSQMMDFVKEIAVTRNRWSTFVTGGNSIGGFTSMSLAAIDSAAERQLSSSGAPGTRRCTGLVLMNSAGPVKTRDEITEEQTLSQGVVTNTVAQATAMQALPICKPPPRPVARVFGNVLLGYLRPRIQSICRNLYPTNPSAVDTKLCLEIKRDSLDPGAINVMMAGAKLPPPRTANELLGADFGSPARSIAGYDGSVAESYFAGPVLIAQGVLDPLNNSTDRMLRYRELRDAIEVSPVMAGHCPHDELPDEIASSIVAWMSSVAPLSWTEPKVLASTSRL